MFLTFAIMRRVSPRSVNYELRARAGRLSYVIFSAMCECVTTSSMSVRLDWRNNSGCSDCQLLRAYMQVTPMYVFISAENVWFCQLSCI